MDLYNGQESHESVESDDESPKRYKYVGTSDRVLRPRKKHIEYSMHQKYTDTQLLQIEKEVITKLYNSRRKIKGGGNLKKKRIKKLRVKQNDIFRKVLGTIMTQIAKSSKHAQVNVKEGIRRYGDRAAKAVIKEYAQLDEKGTFEPKDPSELTGDQKVEALNLITIIKEKRCGKIKGRACADGRKQRRCISKEEASSPTMHDDTLVKVVGNSAKIMCKVNDKYENYITTEKGKPVLYLKLRKTLYGCIMSALL